MVKDKLSHRYVIQNAAPLVQELVEHEKDGNVRDDETLLQRHACENKFEK